MRTLIIISHPTIEESLNQQFFKEFQDVSFGKKNPTRNLKR